MLRFWEIGESVIYTLWNQNMDPKIQKLAKFVFHPLITIFDLIPTKFFLQMKEEVKLYWKI